MLNIGNSARWCGLQRKSQDSQGYTEKNPVEKNQKENWKCIGANVKRAHKRGDKIPVNYFASWSTVIYCLDSQEDH